jgi:hypothetical protein
MTERRAIEGYGLHGSEDIDQVYGRVFEPVMPIDPSGPVSMENQQTIKEEQTNKKYPFVTGNEMFSNTDFPLLI